MGHGRIIKLTKTSADGPVEELYIVAEESLAKAMDIIKDQVAVTGDIIENVGKPLRP